jgi:hypothetical protein
VRDAATFQQLTIERDEGDVKEQHCNCNCDCASQTQRPRRHPLWMPTSRLGTRFAALSLSLNERQQPRAVYLIVDKLTKAISLFDDGEAI